MKHRNLITIFYLFAMSALAGGCAGDDSPAEVPGATLSVRVTADGFAAEGDDRDPGSRATDSGYGTTFAANDAIGVFVKNADGSLHTDNLRIVRQSNGTWSATIPYVKDATYYAYYPHQSGMDGKTSVNAILDALAAPGKDQSTTALYTAADAMTATGTPNGSTLTLTFAFTHARGMIEVSLPAEATPSLSFSDGVKPLALGGKWRYLAVPGSTVTLSGSYTLSGTRYAIPATGVTAPATAGRYKKVTIAP